MDNRNVVVYGRPGCGQCYATTIALKARGVDFTYRDVSTDEAAARRAERIAAELGSRQLPLVTAGDRAWAGFRKDRIDSLGPPMVGAVGQPPPTAHRRAVGLEV